MAMKSNERERIMEVSPGRDPDDTPPPERHRPERPSSPPPEREHPPGRERRPDEHEDAVFDGDDPG